MTQPESQPDVSVVIPVYNCGRYLEASLASIADQTLRSIEIVAIDDGSTDGSGERLDAFAERDPRARIIHKPNGGIVSALNQGLAVARGRYIARMDGDDLAHPERLARQMHFLDENPGHVCVGSLYRIMDSEGRILHVQRPSDQSRQSDFSVFPPFVKTVPHPTLMVRTDAIATLGGYRDHFPHAEDHDLFIRLARLGAIAVLPEPLLDYRVHASASSARHRDTQLDSVLKAQAAAMILAQTGTDIFADGRSPDMAEALAGRTGVPGAASWSVLRALRVVEYDLDRRDAAAARRSLGTLLDRMVREQGALRRDGAFSGLARRALRSAARVGYISVRR